MVNKALLGGQKRHDARHTQNIRKSYVDFEAISRNSSQPSGANLAEPMVNQLVLLTGQSLMARVLGRSAIIQNWRLPTICCCKEIRHTRRAELTKITLDHHIQITE